MKVSHLLKMRGLKLKRGLVPLIWTPVASFTDAWIETNWSVKSLRVVYVASFTDAWIETR